MRKISSRWGNKIDRRRNLNSRVRTVGHARKDTEVIAASSAPIVPKLFFARIISSLARAEMKKREIPEEIITEAIGFADTDNEEILAARKLYRELYDKYNAEIKEKAVAVKEAGGLYILGTERHESRRIDNQLRGRSGRQGDEGESCFFLSVEDDLMRIFAGDRLENMMRTLNVEEDMPIESKMLTKIIESSQKKVEGHNFSIRKNVLNYDDVMNTQREIIYKQRSQVLDGEDLHESILKMMEELIESTVNTYLVDDEVKDDWNIVGLKDYFLGWLIGPEDLSFEEDELQSVSKDDIINALNEQAEQLFSNPNGFQDIIQSSTSDIQRNSNHVNKAVNRALGGNGGNADATIAQLSPEERMLDNENSLKAMVLSMHSNVLAPMAGGIFGKNGVISSFLNIFYVTIQHIYYSKKEMLKGASPFLFLINVSFLIL